MCIDTQRNTYNSRKLVGMRYRKCQVFSEDSIDIIA